MKGQQYRIELVTCRLQIRHMVGCALQAGGGYVTVDQVREMVSDPDLLRPLIRREDKEMKKRVMELTLSDHGWVKRFVKILPMPQATRRKIQHN